MSRKRLEDHIGLKLRSLEASDIDEVHRIERQVYKEPWDRKLLADSLQAPMTHSLGLFENESCQAYGIYQVVFSEGHLLNLAVADEFQGKGLGSGLLEAILQDSKKRGAQSFFLEVRPSNAQALQMYEKRGFKPLMSRERYYQDGEAALIMILDLESMT
jgi:ribosomal-protein-alanine N-acetyltransferase